MLSINYITSTRSVSHLPRLMFIVMGNMMLPRLTFIVMGNMMLPRLIFIVMGNMMTTCL